MLLRAMQYAATFGYTVWLRPQDRWLGKGVAAQGSVATPMPSTPRLVACTMRPASAFRRAGSWSIASAS